MPIDLSVVLKGNIIQTILGVESETFEDLIQYDGSTYRDTIDSAFLGRDIETKKPAYEPENWESIVRGTTTTGIPDGENPSATGEVEIVGTLKIPSDGLLGDNITVIYEYPTKSTLPKLREIEDLYFEESDEYNHVEPRPQQRTRTRVRWWNGASFLTSIGTTTSSTTVTLATTSNLIVGQTLAAVGIPINTIILEVINPTSVRISRPATATSTVDAVVSNGVCVAWSWADEVRSLTNGAIRRI